MVTDLSSLDGVQNSANMEFCSRLACQAFAITYDTSVIGIAPPPAAPADPPAGLLRSKGGCSAGQSASCQDHTVTGQIRCCDLTQVGSECISVCAAGTGGGVPPISNIDASVRVRRLCSVPLCTKCVNCISAFRPLVLIRPQRLLRLPQSASCKAANSAPWRRWTLAIAATQAAPRIRILIGCAMQGVHLPLHLHF
jgi:hypothetical protein